MQKYLLIETKFRSYKLYPLKRELPLISKFTNNVANRLVGFNAINGQICSRVVHMGIYFDGRPKYFQNDLQFIPFAVSFNGLLKTPNSLLTPNQRLKIPSTETIVKFDSMLSICRLQSNYMTNHGTKRHNVYRNSIRYGISIFY